jgi:ABC-type transport system substrate-binding protein
VSPNNAPEFFSFNCGNKYFKNPKIRLAFSLAIDRKAFNKDLRDGAAEVMYGMMPKVTQVGDKLYSKSVSENTQILKTLAKENPDPKKLLIEGPEGRGTGSGSQQDEGSSLHPRHHRVFQEEF